MFIHDIRFTGQTSAYVFHSLLNPSASGTLVIVYRMNFAPYAVSETITTGMTQVVRTGGHSGGVLTYDPENPGTQICKRDTLASDSVVEIRTADPTLTSAGPTVCSVPPSIQGTSVTAYSTNQVIQEFLPEYGEFLLRPGEGLAYRQAAGGDADHFLPYQIEWEERPITV